MTGPVFTLKYWRHPPQWYGIGFRPGTDLVFELPQRGQTRPTSPPRTSPARPPRPETGP